MTMRRYIPKDIQELTRWYERFISPLSLAGGFLVDNFILLKRVDVPLTSAVFLTHFAIVGAGTLFLAGIEGGRIRDSRLMRLVPFVPVAMQFSFGGLFSGFVTLYARSATYAGAWIFIVIIGIIALGNERFLRFAHRVSLRLTLIFVALFAFLTFFLPLMMHRISMMLFIAAGLIAFGLVSFFAILVSLIAPTTWHEYRWATMRGIVIAFVVFNALYFTDLIPPLPLALKDAGVYHQITRNTDGSYVLKGESAAWYASFLPGGETIHLVAGESAYVFTAVFAPTSLEAPVLHVWQRYDDTAKVWETVGTVSFTISGGREGGYRGYSAKYKPAPGLWRVNVETQEGRLIARVKFTVVDATTSPALVETEK